MLVCCIPMFAIAAVLVATGAAGSGLLGAAVVCAVMMTLMMSAMHRSDAHPPTHPTDHRPGGPKETLR